MVDIMVAADLLALNLIENGYLSPKSLGSGFNFKTGGRDFAYESGSKHLTKEEAQSWCPYGYSVDKVKEFQNSLGTICVSVTIKPNEEEQKRAEMSYISAEDANKLSNSNILRMDRNPKGLSRLNGTLVKEIFSSILNSVENHENSVQFNKHVFLTDDEIEYCKNIFNEAGYKNVELYNKLGEIEFKAEW